jgi:hypothetical protein
VTTSGCASSWTASRSRSSRTRRSARSPTAEGPRTGSSPTRSRCVRCARVCQPFSRVGRPSRGLGRFSSPRPLRQCVGMCLV